MGLSTVLVPPAEDVRSETQVTSILEYLSHGQTLAVDTETTGLVRHKDHVVFWSISDGERRWCLPRKYLPLFRGVLEDPARVLIFHNVNFDRAMLLNSGIDIHRRSRTQFRCFDTMVMHHMLFDNHFHDLKSLGGNREYLGVPMKSFRETFNSAETDLATKMLSFYETDPMRVVHYASLDAWVTYKLWEKFLGMLSNTVVFDSPLCKNMLEYYLKLEMPMHDVLWQMERRGIAVDLDYMESKRPVIEKEMADALYRVCSEAGKVINPGSPKQLVELFYHKEGMKWVDDKGNPPLKMTDGGASGDRKPSVDEDVLVWRASELGCKIANHILKYRELQKLKGTYLDGLVDRCDSAGRLHTSFTQSVAATGRLSSRDPNLCHGGSQSS